MDIRRAIDYLKSELRDLDRVIDAIEGAVATHYEKRIKKGVQEPTFTPAGESLVSAPGSPEQGESLWLQ